MTSPLSRIFLGYSGDSTIALKVASLPIYWSVMNTYGPGPRTVFQTPLHRPPLSDPRNPGPGQIRSLAAARRREMALANGPDARRAAGAIHRRRRIWDDDATAPGNPLA